MNAASSTLRRSRPHAALLFLLLLASTIATPAAISQLPPIPNDTAPGSSTADPHLKVEVLSDTQGTNFTPYLKDVLPMIRTRWLNAIVRESATRDQNEHTSVIRFRIMPNGTISYMHLDSSTANNVSFDRAAWSGITGASPLPPLPGTFPGPYLELRINFVVTALTAH